MRKKQKLNLNLIHSVYHNKLNDIINILKNNPKCINDRIIKDRSQQHDFDGKSAFIIAACYSRNKICDILLDSPYLDPNIQDKRNMTALHYLAVSNDEKIAKMLLTRSLSLNIEIVNYNNSTPLKLAYEYNNTNLIKLLIKFGAKCDNWREWETHSFVCGLDPKKQKKTMIEWRSYLPQWTLKTHKYYPLIFGTLVPFYLWLFKKLNVTKDIRFIIVQKIAKNWRKIKDLL